MEYMPKEKEQTKSKWLALFLAWACQLHLLYLGRPGEFFKRTLIGITLIGTLPWAYWWIRDIFQIATGKINQDANGVPLR
ncbi:MAG TPA: hypothetical protein IAB02_04045 [Candidatus Pullichristensenella excrementigallinarum]|uniref:Uncharacterized protein n=1 Tax=Candidatus Pullichristensenella excrementigallinarum TaxID=2840907 RepID=A0A9D1IAJ7_9FIRM|nr:hypothetical protein [Candidatus Pullichristensenella excrementigallinarum]